jgi:hypothetical protein
MVGIMARFVVPACLLAVAWGSAEAVVDVRVNRTELSVDESFTVIYETDSNRAADPDFSVLEGAFEILSSRRRSNYSLVNGRMTGSTAWELELIARETGTIELPPVRFGNESSQALTITVNAKKPDGDSDGPLLLELEVSDLNPYVQGEVICTLRMYFDIASAERRLSEPEMQGLDAVIKRLGDDRSYFATRSQRRYEVIERRYGIYPQASGTLDLAPFSLQARILDKQRSFLSRTGTMHRVQSAPVEIEVRPIPTEFPGAVWLPARELDLERRLDAPTPLHAGEPVGLNLEIRAAGLNASQLPDPEITWPAGLRVYPESPTSEEQSDITGTRAVRRLSLALIASEAGTYEIPPLRIPWWNTATDRLEYAELPARTLTVLAPPGAAATPVQAPTDTATVAVETAPASLWRNVSIVLGLGWLATLLLWQRNSGAEPRVAQARPTAEQSPGKPSLHQFERACNADDPAGARAALVEWCRARWPGQAGLGALRDKANEPLRQELDVLDQVLYATPEHDWDGARLNQLLIQQFSGSAGDRTGRSNGLVSLHRLPDTPHG